MKMTFEVRLDWILRLSQVSFIWLVLRKGNGPVYVDLNNIHNVIYDNWGGQ